MKKLLVKIPQGAVYDWTWLYINGAVLQNRRMAGTKYLYISFLASKYVQDFNQLCEKYLETFEHM